MLGLSFRNCKLTFNMIITFTKISDLILHTALTVWAIQPWYLRRPLLKVSLYLVVAGVVDKRPRSHRHCQQFLLLHQHTQVHQRFFNPIRTIHPPPTVFCPLLKKSSCNPYLKFLDFSQLLVAETPMKFFFRKILFPPSDSTFETPSTKIFFCFWFDQKNLFTKPSWNDF